MDPKLPQLSPVTEGSREGSPNMTEALSQNQSMMSALMTMVDNINRRFEEDDRRRKRKEQERESLSTVGHAASSLSVFPPNRRADKTPMYTLEDNHQRDRRPYTQLFPERGTEEAPPERITTEAPPPFSRKLEIPDFDGTGTENWLARVEQFFEGNYCSDHQKIVAVRESFTGDALDWNLWQKDRDPFLRWAHLKQRILNRFATYRDESPGRDCSTSNKRGPWRSTAENS